MYSSLEAINIKKSLIINGMTNWNQTKSGMGFCWVFNGFHQKTQWVFLGITLVSKPWKAENNNYWQSNALELFL